MLGKLKLSRNHVRWPLGTPLLSDASTANAKVINAASRVSNGSHLFRRSTGLQQPKLLLTIRWSHPNLLAQPPFLTVLMLLKHLPLTF